MKSKSMTRWLLTGLLAAFVLPTSLKAEAGPEWLKKAVFYQIYPSSYMDSDGNGIGDLPGITSKLDYLQSLGITAVWLNPIYVSGWQDGGYDVIDFYQVDPRFGTNTDESTRAKTSGGLMTHMTPKMIIQYLGIITDTTLISDLSFTANIVLPDDTFTLVVKDGVVLYEQGTLAESPDVTWTTNKAGLFGIIQNNADLINANLTQDGDTELLGKLMSGITGFADAKFFSIVEP